MAGVTGRQMSEDSLMCSICVDTLRDPVTLLCQHSFCRSCLQMFAEQTPPVQTGSEVDHVVSCPVCRTPAHLGSKGVTGLLTDAKLREATETSCRDSRGTRGEEMCDMCDKDTQAAAVKFCPTCGVLYCEQCLNGMHPMRGPLGRHQLVAMEEYMSMGSTESHVTAAEESPEDSRPLPSCDQHNQPFSVFCIPCKKLVCNGCFSQHDGHGIRSIQTACGELKTPLVAKTKECEKVNNEVTTTMSGWNKLENDVKLKLEKEVMPCVPLITDLPFKTFLWQFGAAMTDDDLKCLKFLTQDFLRATIIDSLDTPDKYLYQLIHRGILSMNNIITLQTLVWCTGRSDLFKMLEKFGEDHHGVLHMCIPNTEPVNGYRHVDIHLKGWILSNDEVDEIRAKLALMMHVPLHSIIVTGIQKTGSWLITFMVPERCSENLLARAKRHKIWFARRGVDFLEFGHEKLYISGRSPASPTFGEMSDTQTAGAKLKKPLRQKTEECGKMNSDIKKTVSGRNKTEDDVKEAGQLTTEIDRVQLTEVQRSLMKTPAGTIKRYGITTAKSTGLHESSSPFLLCHQHGQSYSLFCIQCKTLICNGCLTESHHGHGMSHIQKMRAELKTPLVAKTKECENVNKEVTTTMSGWEEVENDVKQNGELHRVDIERAYTSALKVLNTWRSKSLDTVDKQEEEWTGRCKASAKELNMVTEELRRLMATSHDLTSSSDDTQFVQDAGMLTTRMDNQLKELEVTLNKQSEIKDKLLSELKNNPISGRKVIVKEGTVQAVKEGAAQAVKEGTVQSVKVAKRPDVPLLSKPEIKFTRTDGGRLTISDGGSVVAGDGTRGVCQAWTDGCLHTGRVYWEVELSVRPSPGSGCRCYTGVVREGCGLWTGAGRDCWYMRMWYYGDQYSCESHQGGEVSTAYQQYRHNTGAQRLGVFSWFRRSTGAQRLGVFLDCVAQTLTFIDCHNNSVMCTVRGVCVSDPGLSPAVSFVTLEGSAVSARLVTGDRASLPRVLSDILQVK